MGFLSDWPSTSRLPTRRAERAASWNGVSRHETLPRQVLKRRGKEILNHHRMCTCAVRVGSLNISPRINSYFLEIGYAFMSSAYVSSLTPVRPLLSTHSTQQDQGQMREQSREEEGRDASCIWTFIVFFGRELMIPRVPRTAP